MSTSLAIELGKVLFAVTVGELVKALLASSGKQGESVGVNPRIGEAIMSGYDLVGHDDDWDDDDDDMGGIGADDIEDILFGLDVIGDDDDDDDDDDDYLEDLLVEGAGDSEIVGAKRRGKKRRSRRRKGGRKAAILRRLVARNAGAVINTGLSRRRRYPLGFVPTNILAGASSQVPAAPQNLFRPERLVIPSDIAFDTGVRDIKVGNTSQLVQSVEVPAALFSEVAINTGVTFDTAEVGNQVSVDARNKSGLAFEFSAGLVGTIAKG